MIEVGRKLYIRNRAAEILLAQETLSSVVDVRDMRIPKNVYIVDFQKYSDITGISVDELTDGGALSDGYTIRSEAANIVLYDKSLDFNCPQRLRFSLAHEIGHIVLEHRNDDAESEEEANYFASQIVAHDAIVISFLIGSWNLDIERIRERFGISWDTARIKLLNINRNRKAYSQTENMLFVKYRSIFSRQEIKRNKFATDMKSIDFDEAYA